MMLHRLLVPALGSLALGCSEPSVATSGTASGTASGPSLVCTTVMVGDVVRGVASDNANITVLFGSDVDPHLFRPTRDDVAALTSADAIFASGLHLEANLLPTLKKLAGEGISVTYLAEAILTAEEQLMESGDVVDPHVWMDPSLWARTPRVVADALTAVNGTAWSGLDDRATALSDVYRALGESAGLNLESIPQESRVLISAHDAFGYFGRRYGLEVHAIQGVSTASEAGLGAMEDLVDLIVERRALAVFFESTVSERSVRALIEGAGARNHKVAVGGVLHSDAPGHAKSYIGMIEHNVRTITVALGGTLVGDAGAIPSGTPSGPPSGEAEAPAR